MSHGLHREIHSLEARIVRDENELVRNKKQLEKLKAKLLLHNIKEAMRTKAIEAIEEREEKRDE